MSVEDNGLQVQRCALAWTRTGLAAIVNALLMLRAGGFGAHRWLSALGVLVLLAAVVLIAFGMQRRRQLGALSPNAPAASLVLGAVFMTWLACLGGAAAVAFY